jgi:hypothetical protein
LPAVHGPAMRESVLFHDRIVADNWAPVKR